MHGQNRKRARSRMRGLWIPVACLGIASYFSYHLYHGAFGVTAMERLERRAVTLTERLEALEAERAALEQRIALMKPEELDPDMLDERARLDLNYADPHELVIMLDRRAAD